MSTYIYISLSIYTYVGYPIDEGGLMSRGQIHSRLVQLSGTSHVPPHVLQKVGVVSERVGMLGIRRHGALVHLHEKQQ